MADEIMGLREIAAAANLTIGRKDEEIAELQAKLDDQISECDIACGIKDDEITKLKAEIDQL